MKQLWQYIKNPQEHCSYDFSVKAMLLSAMLCILVPLLFKVLTASVFVFAGVDLMAKIQTRNKQNPKLQQSELKDGRASLYLECYLGRTETPVLDDEGNQVYYTTGAMAGKPKYKVKHDRRKENLNFYIWLHPRNMAERTQNKNTLALAEKIRFEREQAFLADRAGYRLKKERQNNFLEYFKEKCESERFTYYVRKSVVQTYNRFIRFLKESPRYSKYDKFMHMETVNPSL